MDKIKQRAISLKRKYRTSCPFDICKEMGIPVIKRELPENIKGIFYKCLKNYIIILNSDLDYEESRITAAHELGHLLLHGATNSFQLQQTSDIFLNKMEKQADYFASCLLIDEDSFELCDKSDGMTLNDIAYANRVPVYFAQLYSHMI